MIIRHRGEVCYLWLTCLVNCFTQFTNKPNCCLGICVTHLTIAEHLHCQMKGTRICLKNNKAMLHSNSAPVGLSFGQRTRLFLKEHDKYHVARLSWLYCSEATVVLLRHSAHYWKIWRHPRHRGSTHNILQHRQRTETGNMHRKHGKIGTYGSWDMRLDRQTDRQTNPLQYSASLPRGSNYFSAVSN